MSFRILNNPGVLIKKIEVNIINIMQVHIAKRHNCSNYEHYGPFGSGVAGVCLCCHGNEVSIATIYSYFPKKQL